MNYGTILFDVYSHGSTSSWAIISGSQLKAGLNNINKTPFCISSACHTGKMTAFSMAADINTYSVDKGFVGMFAASTSAGEEGFSEGGLPINYSSHIPKVIFNHLSTVMGEFLLETKIYFAIHNNSIKGLHNFNLFGDPALNLMAEGFEITKLLTTGDTTVISCPVTIRRGGGLAIPNNGKLFFTNRGNLIYDNEGVGNLSFGINAVIKVYSDNNTNSFIKFYNTPTIGTNVTIENMEFIFSLERGMNTKIYNAHFINSRIKYSQKANVTWVSPEWYNFTFLDSEIDINNRFGFKFSNCNFTNSNVLLTSNLNNQPALTTFTNSQFTNSPISHKNHKLDVTNCTFSSRSDIITTYSIVNIQNCRFLKSGFKAGIPQPFPLPELFISSVTITGSSFRNTGQYLAGYGGNERPPIYSKASIMLDGIKEFHLVGDTIINVNAGRGDIGLPPEPQVAPFGEGIYINGAGKGSANKNLISGNDITQCETGLYIYSSKATVNNNDIHNNTFGVKIFNNSSTAFTGETNIANGQQFIQNNGKYQLYASNNAFPASFRYNQILRENNPLNIPRIYYDVLIRGIDPGNQLEESPKNISCNYWGNNFDHNENIYPPKKFITAPTWDPQGAPCTSGGKALYETGVDYFADENYIAAKTAFIELIETYPEDPFAIASLHELFALEQFLDNDYASLANYYAIFKPADSTLFEVADFLATRCNVVAQNWQPAINWYENRIENPPSYQDSVFSVIDLGDIHLMMEDDTIGGNGAKSNYVYYRLEDIKPHSKQEYETNKANLLLMR